MYYESEPQRAERHTSQNDTEDPGNPNTNSGYTYTTEFHIYNNHRQQSNDRQLSRKQDVSFSLTQKVKKYLSEVKLLNLLQMISIGQGQFSARVWNEWQTSESSDSFLTLEIPSCFYM